jgi:hypothetical protein
MRWTLWTPFGFSDSVESFGEAAFLFEGFGLGRELAVQERDCDADENEYGVGGEFGVGGLDGREGRNGRDGLGWLLSMASIVSISSVGQVVELLYPGGDFVGSFAAAGYELFAARVVVLPESQASLAQEVLVVEAEFFEAGARDVCQFELGLF